MYALEIKGLTKVYKGGVKALNNIDLKVKKGDFFGLLGPNGAGKTTTIGIITGVVDKTDGEVKVFGHDITQNPALAKLSIGVVPQEIQLYPFDYVEDQVINQAGYYGIPREEAKKRSEKLLKDLHLWDKRRAYVITLSGGMKRRLMIAKALVHNPKLLILDEPTAGVDPALRASTWELIKKLNRSGITIILTTHYLEEAEALCKHIAIIGDGKILENAPTKSIIQKVNQETFVLELSKPIKSLTHEKFKIEIIDKDTIEVTVSKEDDLNELFRFLDKKRIKVLTLKNKQNRLEKYFLEVVKK